MTVYSVKALTGDAEGSLDALGIDSANGPSSQSNDLVSGDMAIFADHTDTGSGRVYLYVFHLSDTGAENSPYVVRPTDYVSEGLWKMVSSNIATTTATLALSTAVVHPLLCIDASGDYVEADATTDATVPVVGMAIESSTGTDRMVLIEGPITYAGWSFSDIGGDIYLSESAGEMTQDISGFASGSQVQKIGYATSATSMYLKIDRTILEVA